MFVALVVIVVVFWAWHGQEMDVRGRHVRRHVFEGFAVVFLTEF